MASSYGNELISINSRKKYISKLLEKESLDEDDKFQVKQLYDKYYKPLEGEIKRPVEDIKDICIIKNAKKFHSKCLGFKFGGDNEFHLISKRYLTGGIVSEKTLLFEAMRNELKDLLPKSNHKNEDMEIDDHEQESVVDHNLVSLKQVVDAFLKSYQGETARTNEDIKHSKLNAEMREAWLKFYEKYKIQNVGDKYLKEGWHDLLL